MAAASSTAVAARGTEDPRVVLVDDDAVFRASLRGLLAAAGLDVVGEGANGEEALGLVRELVPEVVLMDVNMPVLDGVRATERIAAFAPEVNVVMVTSSADEGDVVDAVMAGACGYLLKDSPLEDFLSGIRAAAAGEALLSPGIAAHLLRRVRAQNGSPSPGEPGLSPRELELLALLASGRDNNEIAAALYLSPKTVKNSVTRILKKLQLRNRIEAAVYAARRGLA